MMQDETILRPGNVAYIYEKKTYFCEVVILLIRKQNFDEKTFEIEDLDSDLDANQTRSWSWTWLLKTQTVLDSHTKP